MTTVETKITVLNNTAAQLLIRFELTNRSDSSVQVLKRNTPLEGLRSDCLIVKADGEKISYDGYFVKRSAPKPSEYVTIKKGETLHRDVDVSEAYDVSKPAAYEIKFDDSHLVILPVPDENEAGLLEINKEVEDLQTDNQEVAVARTATEAGKQTIGEQMREEGKKKLFELAELATGVLKRPKIVGGSDYQKKVIRKAHKNCYKYVQKAISEFDNNAHYRKWFGEFTVERSTIAGTVLGKIKERMEGTRFSYHINGSECEEGVYAYTTIGGYVIWLCSEFWLAEDEGLSSRAGTFVHEHSHASGGTEDYKYSEEKCILLAAKQPAKAIRNADNYEFYAESYFAE